MLLKQPEIVLLDKSSVKMEQVQWRPFQFSEFTWNNSNFGSLIPIFDIFVILGILLRPPYFVAVLFFPRLPGQW